MPITGSNSPELEMGRRIRAPCAPAVALALLLDHIDGPATKAAANCITCLRLIMVSLLPRKIQFTGNPAIY
jgi:hypothetical protein